ncbi:MAG TPA: acyl carrier protein [Candidatus Polarisedimenticolia bacterium]|nr:acyl carrier protein [Candidatus Polarisedimenticolia bacterium]
MTHASPAPPIEREKILADLIGIIADIVQDWDLDFSGGITPETRLVADLGFQSIDIVMLMGEIHKHYDRRNLPFEGLLLSGGKYVDEIRIKSIADFLLTHLNRPADRPVGQPVAGGDR